MSDDVDPCVADPRDPCDKHGRCHCMCPCGSDEREDNCDECIEQLGLDLPPASAMEPGLPAGWSSLGYTADCSDACRNAP